MSGWTKEQNEIYEENRKIRENCDLSCVTQSLRTIDLLQELLSASSPYLKRKKMTPRHECNKLNQVWKKCSEYLEVQNEWKKENGQ